MERDNVVRVAGLLALVAVPIWIVGASAEMFRTMMASEALRNATTYAVAMTLVLLLMPALAVYRHCRTDLGRWISAVTALGMLGMLAGAAAGVLFVREMIGPETFRMLAVSAGILFFVWVGALALLGIHFPQVPTPVGWFSFGVIAAILLALGAAAAHLDVAMLVTGVGFTAFVTFWLIELGTGLVHSA